MNIESFSFCKAEKSVCIECSASSCQQSRLHSHMKGHVRSVENETRTWRNCSFTDGNRGERQTCLVHVDVCLLACLKLCVVFFLCRWIPVPSISCVFLFKLHIHTGESDGPTYKLMSRVRILLLVPCYFNETDSGSVKIFIFLVLFLFSLYIFLFRSPNPFILSTCRLIRCLIP